jgi:cytochrome c oxidase assembly factor CtaG
MSNFQRIPDSNEEKDQQLWEIAQKRASFKRHLMTYIVINIFMWIIWAMTGAHTYNRGMPWPLWSTLGWGIGLAFHYFGAYVTTGDNSVEREYEKLKNKQ